MRRAGIALASVFGVGVVAAVIGVIVLIVVAVNSLNGIASSSATPRALTCPAAASQTVGGVVVPAGPIGGFCQDRLVNAAQVIRAAREARHRAAHAGGRRDDRDRRVRTGEPGPW